MSEYYCGSLYLKNVWWAWRRKGHITTKVKRIFFFTHYVLNIFSIGYFFEKSWFFQKKTLKSIFGEHDYFWGEGGVLLTELIWLPFLQIRCWTFFHRAIVSEKQYFPKKSHFWGEGSLLQKKLLQPFLYQIRYWIFFHFSIFPKKRGIFQKRGEIIFAGYIYF